MKIRRYALCITAVLGLFIPPTVFAQTQGTIRDLGSLGRSSFPFFINNSGQVTGSSPTDEGLDRAFFWSQSTGMLDLGTLGGSGTRSYGINNSGQVVGYSNLPNDTAHHAFIWSQSSGMQDLGGLGGSNSMAYAINNNGQVVGWSWTANGETHAFFWSQSTGMIDLGTLGGFSSYAYAINDSGQVAGTAELPFPVGGMHSFIWSLSPTAISIDIMPGDYPNFVNLKGNVTTPVAILTTDSFDAAVLNAATVFFGANGTEAAPLRMVMKDVNADGRLDMILYFRTEQTGFKCGDTIGVLKGKTLSGGDVEGKDSIVTPPCK